MIAGQKASSPWRLWHWQVRAQGDKGEEPTCRAVDFPHMTDRDVAYLVILHAAMQHEDSYGKIGAQGRRTEDGRF
jgi:hypothetical protein